jgi:hypothetical protein
MPRRDTLDALIADLGKMPAALGRELRPALRKAAQPILTDAKRRASWSSRIPAAISIRSSLSQRNPGVRLVVDAGRAPHARPLEFGSQRNGTFVRHPVFGNRENWVQQRTRPFFFPAVYDGASEVADQSAAAVIAAARAAGFR